MYERKPFEKQHKEMEIASFAFIFVACWLIAGALMHSSREGFDLSGTGILIAGSIICCYSIVVLFLYWKCANYQEKNKLLPKWFRIISAIFLIFYLALFQLEDNTKTYKKYLLLKEFRFYVLLWIVLSILISSTTFLAIKDNSLFWFGISFGTVSLLLILDIILAICIWSYNGTKNNLLLTLSILTLNYKNYRFYKIITNLNSSTQDDQTSA